MKYPGFDFQITKTAQTSRARLGRLSTPHGGLDTPSFIFCGTKATVKGVTMEEMRALDTQIILANTYHLMLQPGDELVAKMGGLHTFSGWQGPMLTDSGGFQVFSLGHGSVAEEIKGRRSSSRPKSVLEISEEGVAFKSYIDGRRHFLSPERSMEIQRNLGADLIVVFDECTPFHAGYDYTRASMERTHRWGDRCLTAFSETHDGRQALYGIIQGGVFEDLRKISVDAVNDRPFFGHAIGGSLGADKDQMDEVVAFTAARLSPERPIHLLGIGGVRDIFNGVRSGIDTFDCVHPTRIARHGSALMRGHPREHINLRNARYRDDPAPLDPTILSPAANVSRAYIHHLLKAGESLAFHLLTLHNVAFMNQLLRDIRQGIQTDTLDQVQKDWI